MSVPIHLGSLRLSCPSTGLDLALTSNASISTLAQSCSYHTPSITDIESGRIWLAPTTNLKLLLTLIWPSYTSDQQNNAVTKCLLTALRRAPLWGQLNLQPSLTAEPSQCSNTCFFIISLTPASSLTPKKKLPIHRLENHVPFSHLKPPDGLPHWILDQIHLNLDIGSSSSSQSFTTDADIMLFETSTHLENKANLDLTSSTKINSPEQIIGMIDVALRQALTDLPSRAFSGIKITEKSSFKHLDDICPAMWSPGHLEALASRAVFLPTISHAISNSISQRAHSFSLKEKLREIARQEPTIASTHTESQAIQKAVSIRLWRLMQRRLRDPSAAKKLSPMKTSDVTISSAEQDEDADNILSFEYDDERPVFSKFEGCFDLDDEAGEEDLLEVEYDSEWEDLFTDPGVVTCSSDDDEMLDCLYEDLNEDEDENLFSDDLEDDITSALEDMLEL